MTTANRLLNNAMNPLPLGSIRPAGWLLNQLRIQADGLSGHLDEFWPDIAASGWIGGDAEGWERGPYWLDGVVPLAFLLEDERLKAKVMRWIDYIVNHQQEDGWLGPIQDGKYGYEYDPWPVFLVLKAMTQYHEATHDSRIIPTMQRFLRKLQILIEQRPLQSWAQMRSADLILSIYWLYRRTGEDWLLDLAAKVQEQSYNWSAQYEDLPFKDRQSEWTFQAHVVNNAMAIKQPALWYQLTHEESDKRSAPHIIALLDAYHGQATGIFSGDEVLAGKNPSQGTELCAVVEYMFSLEVLLAVFGDIAYADRLERIAFNALPATFKPDMWAHQYDQQANQVMCVVAQEHVYTTNGPDANLFGLEPNFGCCTANMHQGWPKFAAHLWMRTSDDGLAAVSYAPCIVTAPVADTHIRIEVRTGYPFEETIQLIVSPEKTARFSLDLRIPAWTREATLTMDDETGEDVESGSFHHIEREWSGTTVINLHLPMPLKTQTRYHNSVSIERGPLVYALKIDEEWRQIRGELPHADWEVYPHSPWNYALEIDRSCPERSYTLATYPISSVPFSPTDAPIYLYLKGRRVPDWGIERNAAAPMSFSPVMSTEPLEQLTLMPYGCTNLRITEFPTPG